MESTTLRKARSVQSAARLRRAFFTVIGGLLLVVLSMITIHLQSSVESAPPSASVSVVTETPSILADVEASADLSVGATAPTAPSQPQHLDWMTLCFLAMLATIALLVRPHRLRTLTLNVARAPGVIQPLVDIPILRHSPIELSVIRVTHAGNAALRTNIRRNTLQRHDCNSPGIFGYASLLRRNDVHDDTTFERVSEPTFHER